MRILLMTLTILFAACVLMVAFFNPDRVMVRLWPDEAQYSYPDTPIGAVIFLSAVAGVFFTGIIAVLEGSKTRLSNARLRAQVRRLQQEVETMRRPAIEIGAGPPRPVEPFPLEAEVDEEIETV